MTWHRSSESDRVNNKSKPAYLVSAFRAACRSAAFSASRAATLDLRLSNSFFMAAPKPILSRVCAPQAFNASKTLWDSAILWLFCMYQDSLSMKVHVLNAGRERVSEWTCRFYFGVFHSATPLWEHTPLIALFINATAIH
jgi:hypothetical protein